MPAIFQIDKLKKAVGKLFEKNPISPLAFLLCNSCKRPIIENIIEVEYALNDGEPCSECATRGANLAEGVFDTLEGLFAEEDRPIKRYLGDRRFRRNLIAILNGITTVGATLPCVFPHTCSIELTYRCNQKCRHCYLGTPPSCEEMSTEVVKNVIQDLAETGFVAVALSGGEPLLRNDLLAIMNEVKKYGMEVVISTNGTLLNKKMAQDFAAYVDLICISIDSHEEIIHDEFRGMVGAQKQSLYAIEYALSHGIRVRTFTTLTKFNHNRIAELVAFLENRGVVEIGFFDLNPVGRGLESGLNMQISVEEYRRAVQTIAELNENSKMTIDVLAPLEFREPGEYGNLVTLLTGGFCNAGINTLNISPDGFLQPCSRLRYNLANVKNEKIIDVWRSSRVLAEIRDRSRLKGVCGGCANKYLCGGCRANAYSAHGDYLGGDPRCAV